MEETRKRARNAGNEVAGVAGVPAAKDPEKSADAAAATKIAELQAELET